MLNGVSMRLRVNKKKVQDTVFSGAFGKCFFILVEISEHIKVIIILVWGTSFCIFPRVTA